MSYEDFIKKELRKAESFAQLQNNIMGRYSETERVGINKIESIFLSDFKWIFREQPIVDMGIDAHVELVNDGNPTGKLIALQIKSGECNFYEKEDSYTFYVDPIHYSYWVNHSLPVFIIGYLPKSAEYIWAHIDPKGLDKTKKGWKVEIPKSNNLLDSYAKYQIGEIINSTLTGKMTKLVLDAKIMKYIKNGGKVILYTMEWHNKSLGRGPFDLIFIDKNGNEESIRQWQSFYTLKLADLIEKTFPWADIEVDAEFYEENFNDSFYEVYSDTYIENNKIYPYETESGEVSRYRINLRLNKIGKAYLDISEYLK